MKEGESPLKVAQAFEVLNKIYHEVTENLNDDNELEEKEDIHLDGGDNDDVILDEEESHFKKEEVVEALCSRFGRVRVIFEDSQCKGKEINRLFRQQ